MTIRILVLSILFTVAAAAARAHTYPIRFGFYGDTFYVANVNAHPVNFSGPLTGESISTFYNAMNANGYEAVIEELRNYRQRNHPDDWMFYQLIRRTVENISPKKANYLRYTLYKWFLLSKSGFDATLRASGDTLLFYVHSNDAIFDIPGYTVNGKQYICLNYHDYKAIDFTKTAFAQVNPIVPGAVAPFSYKLTRLPSFTAEDYEEKELSFSYHNVSNTFRVKLNKHINDIFRNYPTADYILYFDAPLSSQTYGSLIPQLKEKTFSMTVREGVDYLMRFTRYAFLYRPDGEHFGREKRMLAEQTLLYDGSDCEDRSALFFYLVKELYNLPMLVLEYPSHVSVAVKFDKPVGSPIVHNGIRYSLCDPTPQKDDVPIGKIPKFLSEKPYEIAFVYDPKDQ